MTREEAIKQLKGDITESCATFSNQWEKDEEAISVAISALSVEPCRDADDYENEISGLHNRLDIAEYNKGYKEEITITTLEAENKGEWIEVVAERFPNGEKQMWHYECSVCGTGEPSCPINKEHWDFCPNCGAKMKGGE